MTSADAERPVSVGVADKQHAALAFAAEEARLARCALQVVHAYSVPPGPPDPVSAVYGIDIEGSFRESGREVLSEATDFLAQGYADVPLHPVLAHGRAPAVLTEVAGSSRLLVVGPDDASPWYSRLFQGRVSRTLAEAAACPVVVVPDTWEPGRTGRGVTLLVDSRSVAHGPLRYAFDHAARHGEELSIVHFHVATGPADGSVPWHDMYRLIDSWQAMYPSVCAGVRVVDTGDDPAPGVADVEPFEHTGLLVLGRPHGRKLTRRLHQSLALAVIEHAGCPVVVVPPDHEV